MRFNLNEEDQLQAPNEPIGPQDSDPANVEKFKGGIANLHQLQKQMNQDFALLCKDFFAAVPAIKSLTWTQYTDYFCDGDPCYFSVHEVYFSTDDNPDGEARPEKDGKVFSGDLYDLKKRTNRFTSEQIELCQEMCHFITGNSALMNLLFGDHIMVIARENAITTKEYDDHN